MDERVTSSDTSIFISHINGDPDADEVVKALVSGLKQKLGPSHDAYEIVYDRDIAVGAEWRRTIYDWLCDCRAAIIMVTQAAFDPVRPWVSHEAFFLTVSQLRRSDLCIVPVLLKGVESLLRTPQSIFDPSRLAAIQAQRYPDPPGVTRIDELVTKIAERLKRGLPAKGETPLIGLAKELRDRLSELPKPAQQAAAATLDPTSDYIDAAHLAEQFLAANDSIKVDDAFYALCHNARQSEFLEAKEAIAHILAAQHVNEDDAKPIAIEAALPHAAGFGRALLLDSEDVDIIDLYLTRVTRRVPHAWVLTDGPDVLEYGHLDDLRKGVRKIITQKFGANVGRSEALQLTRANAVVAHKRKAGFPVLLKLKYPEDHDPTQTFHAVRDVCPELMVIYTTPPAPPGFTITPQTETGVRQITPLGKQGYERMIGPYGSLIDHCRSTTPGWKLQE
jgi:hypothetical protein